MPTNTKNPSAGSRPKTEQNPESSRVETAETPTPGDRIRDVSHGFRLSFSGLSRTKTVKEDVQQEIADEYDADKDTLRTIKRLIPSSHPAVKAVEQAKRNVEAFYHSQTLPFPEKGVRLFCSREADEVARAEEVEKFLDRLQALIGDYYRAAAELNERWQSVLEVAKRDQGKLFDPADYPASVADRMQCKIYPFNVDIPEYYRRMSPRHFMEARQMLRARFEEAARMQEVVLAKAVSGAVDQLVASVTDYHGGKQKTFKNSVVENVLEAVKEFDAKARSYGIGGEKMAAAFDDLYKALTTDGSGRQMRPQDVAEELRRDKDLAEKMTQSLTQLGINLGEMADVVVPPRLLARRK